MILYELITLKQPYYQVPPMQVPALISEGKLPQFPSEPAPMFKSIVDIMKVCLIMDAEARPSSDLLVKMFDKLI
jgi:hypothetical protein